jgi:hypothetical protein
MEPKQPDTKRQLEFERDEAGRDAKRFCQLAGTLDQLLTRPSKFYSDATRETQCHKWDIAARATLGKSPSATLPLSNEFTFSNQSFRYNDLDIGEYGSNISISEPLQYTNQNTTPALTSPACSISYASAQSSTSGHDSKFCNDEVMDSIMVESEPINTQLTAYSSGTTIEGEKHDHAMWYDACFGVVSKRDLDSMRTKY